MQVLMLWVLAAQPQPPVDQEAHPSERVSALAALLPQALSQAPVLGRRPVHLALGLLALEAWGSHKQLHHLELAQLPHQLPLDLVSLATEIFHCFW